MGQEEKLAHEVEISAWRLGIVSAKLPLGQYLRQLWQRRHFIRADSRAKAFATTRGTFLGKVWLVVKPFLESLIFFLIFGLLIGTRHGVENFPAYLVVGVNFFSLISAGLNSGPMIVIGSKNLIHAFAFPRLSLVISWLIRTLWDFLPVYVVTCLVVIFIPPGVTPNFIILLSIPIILIACFFTFGTAALAASLTTRFPDLKFIWPLITRIWFYGSGVFFAIDTLIDDRVLLAAMKANPAYLFLMMSRQVIVYETIPPTEEWVQLALWALGMAVIGTVVFWRHEESYGREI